MLSTLHYKQGNRSPPSFQCSSVGTPMLDTAQQVGITTQERGNEEEFTMLSALHYKQDSQGDK